MAVHIYAAGLGDQDSDIIGAQNGLTCIFMVTLWNSGIPTV